MATSRSRCGRATALPAKSSRLQACSSRRRSRNDRCSKGGYPSQKRRSATQGRPGVTITDLQPPRTRPPRRLDSDQLDSDSAYSEESDYMTDDSAERSSGGVLGGDRRPSGLHRAKVVRITSAAQLKVRAGWE
jgi:hypothetical protein